MQRNSVIQSAPGRWLAGPAIIAGTVLVTACGPSHPTASTSASASSGTSSRASSGASATPVASGVALSPSAAPSTVAAPTPATAPASPAATPAASVNPGGPDASTQTCADKAAHDRFILITAVQQASSGALTVTGHPATIVCGGPDDFHFNPGATTVTGHTVPAPAIQVFPVTQMKPEVLKASGLAGYLKTDGDTRIFLIGGPLTAMTSLQEQFHP